MNRRVFVKRGAGIATTRAANNHTIDGNSTNCTPGNPVNVSGGCWEGGSHYTNCQDIGCTPRDPGNQSYACDIRRMESGNVAAIQHISSQGDQILRFCW